MSNNDAKDYFTHDPSGKATFDGYDLADLAESYPTPFYLFSQKQLRNNFEQFKQAFAGVEGGLSVYYSVKSNFESMILKTLADMGCGAEISGAMDMELAKRAGMKPDQVVFDGPYKPDEDLEAALDWGVHLINIESMTEAKALNDIAVRRGCTVNVGIRIDPLLSKPYYDKVISTYRKKFGLPIDQAAGVGAQIASTIQEKAFDHLDAPVLRVSSLDTPAIYSPPLEAEQFPHAGRIIEKVLTLS